MFTLTRDYDIFDNYVELSCTYLLGVTLSMFTLTHDYDIFDNYVELSCTYLCSRVRQTQHVHNDHTVHIVTNDDNLLGNSGSAIRIQNHCIDLELPSYHSRVQNSTAEDINSI